MTSQKDSSAEGRKLVWFSCGAPSAVAAKLVANSEPCEILYTEVKEEHPDNMRFLRECEAWIGQRVTILGNDKYERSINKVFERERYMVNLGGAVCTKLLKRRVREEYQRSADVHVLGYTTEERDRLSDFREHFPELTIECPLIDRQLGKSDCLAMIEQAGIKLPAMYLLGYNNNNCIGCVKGGQGYFNKIRRDFPEVFGERAAMQRKLGYAFHKINDVPVFLDELPEDAGRDVPEPKIDCSILCLIATKEYSA